MFGGVANITKTILINVACFFLCVRKQHQSKSHKSEKKMNPRRFQEEADYYELILQKYQQLRNNSTPDDRTQYTAEEIVKLMSELGKEKKHEGAQKDMQLMENITKNTLILLLSLFQEKDQTTKYKNYSELSESEKTILKKRLQFITVK